MDVSVIVPAYDPGDLILEALESVFCQTFRNFETIVVDDASTDGLAERLRPYEGRIRYIRLERNSGPAAARNRGIAAARGRYVALLDADDVWLPDRLARLVGLLDAHPEIGFATTDAYILEGDRRTGRRWSGHRLNRFRHRRQEVRILRSNFLNPAVVARRELFERHGPFDETLRIGEDWDRWIAFIRGGERAGYIDDPLSLHRDRPGSLTTDPGRYAADVKRMLDAWAARPLERRASRALAAARAQIDWESSKRRLLAGEGRAVGLARLARSGPIGIRLRALALGCLPIGVARAASRARERARRASAGEAR